MMSTRFACGLETMTTKIVALTLSCLMLLSIDCASRRNYNLVTLPTGKQVKVLSSHPWTFRDGQTSMMLEYETDLKISDSVALRKEVQELWVFFRQELDLTEFTSAIIGAHEAPSGFIVTHSKAFNYVFTKRKDGFWDMAPNYGIPPKAH